MENQQNLVLCYHRGCGKKFDPKNNFDDSCVHHPGKPVFHDAYKIWSCCNKKSIDFTEFLNAKGCTTSPHSNEKPIEPKTPSSTKCEIEEPTPVAKIPEIRPSFDTPQITLEPKISPSVFELIKDLDTVNHGNQNCNEIVIGQSCKNKGCKGTYKGSQSDEEICMHHPGSPIFHEGMKYWSCCQKKTSDFTVFLEQAGCEQSRHKWFSEDSEKKIQCRMDWHQTGSNVTLSIYAKKYSPNASSIKLSPVRLTISIYFPEGKSRYELDMELYNPIVVENSKASMTPSKIEITLGKSGPEHWQVLEILRNQSRTQKTQQYEDQTSGNVDSIDLSDL